MANDKITITDAITGETIEREMTDAEQKERDAFLKQIAKEEADAKTEAKAKAQAKVELLAKLGITLEEANLLLS